MKTEFILIILEFFGILMVLGEISMIAMGISGLYKRIKELKMDDVKETTPDKVDNLEIAEYVKNTFLKQFRELAWSLCCTYNVIDPSYSVEGGDPYKLRLNFGKNYSLLIKMDPGSGRFMLLEERIGD